MPKRTLVGLDRNGGRARWSWIAGVASFSLLLAPAAGGASAMASDEAVVLPRPSMDVTVTSGPQKAILAGGCFWGVQGVFQHVHGVTSAVSGYAGGPAPYGWLRHPLSGDDPQEGDDDDGDHRFG